MRMDAQLSLSISAETSAEKMGRQVRHAHPRQDQEAALVGDLVQVRLAHGPFDAAIAHGSRAG